MGSIGGQDRVGCWRDGSGCAGAGEGRIVWEGVLGVLDDGN